MTPEELAVEKLRQQKLQEEAELQMVKSTFGALIFVYDAVDICSSYYQYLSKYFSFFLKVQRK
jgi:hypothetical protein